MSKDYYYLVNCVGLHGNQAAIDSLIEMTQFSEETQEITWETFRQHVPVDEVKATFPQYSYRGETYNPQTGELTIGFHLKDDFAVSFWRGEFLGETVYYILHSAIEYIFAKPDHPYR